MRTRRPEHPDVTFRSKLEGQWSVILDALCLPWEFEPTRFDLPSGIYVPDFKVFPELGDERSFWIEVKGPWPNAREFEVASEVNIYTDSPLLILSGDIPRTPNGGTGWWFDPATSRWSMLRAEEALIRVIYRHVGTLPNDMGQLWATALDEARDAELIRVGA